jgi:hypothetical protein
MKRMKDMKRIDRGTDGSIRFMCSFRFMVVGQFAEGGKVPDPGGLGGARGREKPGQVVRNPDTV